MRYFWSRFIIFMLALEAVIFVINYHYGASGLRILQSLKKTKNILHHDIAQLQAENSLLQEQIDEWSSELFFQEKYAREKLQMQKKDEKIYLR